MKRKISRKIFQIIKEKAKLLKIMDEKSNSMKRFNMSNDFRKELHGFTGAIRL